MDKTGQNDQSKRGRRVQIYLPADLLERWDQTPRYERSAIVAQALRRIWGMGGLPTELPTSGDSGYSDFVVERG